MRANVSRLPWAGPQGKGGWKWWGGRFLNSAFKDVRSDLWYQIITGNGLRRVVLQFRSSNSNSGYASAAPADALRPLHCRNGPKLPSVRRRRADA